MRWALFFILGLVLGWFGSLITTLSLVAGVVTYSLLIWFWKPILRCSVLLWAVTIIFGTVPGVAMHIYKSHEKALAQQAAYQNWWIKQAKIGAPTIPPISTISASTESTVSGQPNIARYNIAGYARAHSPTVSNADSSIPWHDIGITSSSNKINMRRLIVSDAQNMDRLVNRAAALSVNSKGRMDIIKDVPHYILESSRKSRITRAKWSS